MSCLAQCLGSSNSLFFFSKGQRLALSILTLGLFFWSPNVGAQLKNTAQNRSTPTEPSPPLTPAEGQKLEADLRTLEEEFGGHFKAGRFADAKANLQRNLQILERLFPKSIFPDGHASIQTRFAILGLTELWLEQFPDASKHLRQSLDMIKKLAPKAGQWRDSNLIAFSDMLINHAHALKDAIEKSEQTETCARLAIEAIELTEPTFIDSKRRLGKLWIARNYLAKSLSDQRKFIDSVTEYKSELAILSDLFPNAEAPGHHAMIATTLHDLGFSLREGGKSREAVETLRKALEHWPKAFSKNDPKGQRETFGSLGSLGARPLRCKRIRRSRNDPARRARPGGPALWSRIGHVDHLSASVGNDAQDSRKASRGRKHPTRGPKNRPAGLSGWQVPERAPAARHHPRRACVGPCGERGLSKGGESGRTSGSVGALTS